MAKASRSRVGDFEKSLKELEIIVERMESGDQALRVRQLLEKDDHPDDDSDHDSDDDE
ncbi:MAG: hypothetical protein EBT18_06110 [Gammaproteobacteria bacterium]|nr:hypothetical protein [Gammaproteobacteria bacterium]